MVTTLKELGSTTREKVKAVISMPRRISFSLENTSMTFLRPEFILKFQTSQKEKSQRKRSLETLTIFLPFQLLV